MITPNKECPKLALALEMKSVYFKREDLHPYGSHKGRSIPVMIDKYVEQGIKHFVIPSSGNAALAAAFYTEKLNNNRIDKIILEILVGQYISTKKLRKLEQFKSEYISITMHDRPLQTLFRKTKEEGTVALRQSTDDMALIGYSDLAKELLDIPDLNAIFIGTSSGTTAQALAEYFIKENKKI